jgi:hypothetical protein
VKSTGKKAIARARDVPHSGPTRARRSGINRPRPDMSVVGEASNGANAYEYQPEAVSDVTPESRRGDRRPPDAADGRVELTRRLAGT